MIHDWKWKIVRINNTIHRNKKNRKAEYHTLDRLFYDYQVPKSSLPKSKKPILWTINQTSKISQPVSNFALNNQSGIGSYNKQTKQKS